MGKTGEKEKKSQVFHRVYSDTLYVKKQKNKREGKKKPTSITVKKLRVLDFILTFQIRITRQTLDSCHESLITK